MSLINISNLTFGYDGNPELVFDNVSFQIDTNWKLGFIGRNGKGKTTFLQLLMNKYEYSGTISHTAIFDYFPFQVENPENMVIEILENLDPNLELWQLEKELSQLDVNSEILYCPFSLLSSGEQTKVLLAALFLKENHFLLIDEPTNHLDSLARKIVAKYLNSKKGFILVSHDREFLDACIDHVLSINRHSLEIQKGNFSTWKQNRDNQDNFETREYEKFRKEMRRLAQAVAQTAQWSNQVEASKYGCDVPDRGYVGHKSAKMMKRSKTIEARRKNALEEKTKLLKDSESIESLKINTLQHPKNLLVQACGLHISYGDKHIAGPVDFEIRQGDRISLSGKNGSGKSSILKLLMRKPISYMGTLQIAGNLQISYVPQDTSFLQGSLKAFIDQEDIDESLCKAILHKLDFSREQFDKNMESFSAGQKKKVLIAKSLCQPAHLYIWDEPLNYIDIISRLQIEEMLENCKPTMIFVEHDEAFQKNIATKNVQL